MFNKKKKDYICSLKKMMIMATKTLQETRKQVGGVSAIKDSFTADQLIDAYTKGVDKGIGLSATFYDAITLLRDSSRIILDFYNKNLKGSNCSFVFMRANPYRVNFIAAIDKDFYFNDEACRPIYDASADITREHPNIDISFMPCVGEDSINIAALNADDYVRVI